MARRLLAPALALALVAPCLTACGLWFGGDDLDDALDLVPADATRMTFRDREAIAERLDVDDVEQGADRDDLTRYLDAVRTDATGGGDLLTEFLAVMQTGEVSELTVEWSVEVATEEGAYTAYKVDDDVDLDAVADDLVDAGWTEDEVAGRRHVVQLDGPTEGYPSNWVEIAVDPDEDLLVAGTSEPLWRLVDDEAESLHDTEEYDDLLDDLDDVELAVVSAPPACGSRAATQEQSEASGLGALGSPEVTAYVVAGDDAEQVARLEFEDGDAAEADLEARRTYVEEGVLGATGEPVSSLGSVDLDREGPVVRVGLDLDEPALGLTVALQQDGFLACSAPPDDEDGASDPSAPSAPPATPTPSVTGPTDDSTVEIP